MIISMFSQETPKRFMAARCFEYYPIENVTKEAHQAKVRALFQETKIVDENRYEFFCPGKKIIHLYKTIEI